MNFSNAGSTNSLLKAGMFSADHSSNFSNASFVLSSPLTNETEGDKGYRDTLLENFKSIRMKPKEKSQT